MNPPSGWISQASHYMYMYTVIFIPRAIMYAIIMKPGSMSPSYHSYIQGEKDIQLTLAIVSCAVWRFQLHANIFSKAPRKWQVEFAPMWKFSISTNCIYINSQKNITFSPAVWKCECHMKEIRRKNKEREFHIIELTRAVEKYRRIELQSGNVNLLPNKNS